jgi:hypothetical protein
LAFYIDLRKKPSQKVDSSMLDVLVQDAENRGFKPGKWTIHGEIKSEFDHELLANGDFYFHNIKVYKNGQWIEVLDEKPSEYARPTDEEANEIMSQLFDFLSSFPSTEKSNEKNNNDNGISFDIGLN